MVQTLTESGGTAPRGGVRETPRDFSPQAETQRRLDGVGQAFQTQPETLPAVGMRLALGLVGFALPIVGAAYLVRAGAMTVLGQPPQWLRRLA